MTSKQEKVFFTNELYFLLFGIKQLQPVYNRKMISFSAGNVMSQVFLCNIRLQLKILPIVVNAG